MSPPRRYFVLLVALVIASPVLLIVVLVVAITLADEAAPGAAPPVDPAKIPALARQLLPLITAITGHSCPELPPLWVIAQVQAESSWNPAAFSTDANGGAAGLYQINQPNWTAAGGQPWPSTPPPASADILRPDSHLTIGIPWVCANLRAVTHHLAATGKPTRPLDAMLVCHIAGCARVTHSATGVPRAGEAGCDTTCTQLITRYLDNVHRNLAAYAAATPPDLNIGDLPASPAAYTGAASGCTHADPTGGTCITAATRHGLRSIQQAFGALHNGPVIQSTACWSVRPANEHSDHPLGKACDFFPGPPGRFAANDDLAEGWRVAHWLRTNAGPLRVRYIIWQGRYWDLATADHGGWGIPYNGGGIYDVRDPTGGHYDHVHVSFTD